MKRGNSVADTTHEYFISSIILKCFMMGMKRPKRLQKKLLKRDGVWDEERPVQGWNG